MKEKVLDYVVGAGSAGLQLGYFMQRASWDYLIVEAGSGPGQFFRTFPRQWSPDMGVRIRQTHRSFFEQVRATEPPQEFEK